MTKVTENLEDLLEQYQYLTQNISNALDDLSKNVVGKDIAERARRGWFNDLLSIEAAIENTINRIEDAA